MKICKKIIGILTIAVMLLFCMTVYSNADASLSIKDIQEHAQEFIDKGGNEASGVEADGLLEGVTSVASILTTIGVFVLVIVTIILWIQFMTSSPQKQAVLRSQMIGVLWAAVIILGAYGIWSIGVKIVETF